MQFTYHKIHLFKMYTSRVSPLDKIFFYLYKGNAVCILGSSQKRKQFTRGRNAFQGKGAVCVKEYSSEMAQYLENMKSGGELEFIVSK